MKIAVVTTGRFHVLDLARELAALGHELQFFSCVPRKRAAKFGLPAGAHRRGLLAIAPLLLAEVLVDGALAYALFRHLRGQDPQHWLASTWRPPWLPFLATAVVLAALGAGLAWHTPGATSIGHALARSPVAGQAP